MYENLGGGEHVEAMHSMKPGDLHQRFKCMVLFYYHDYLIDVYNKDEMAWEGKEPGEIYLVLTYISYFFPLYEAKRAKFNHFRQKN